MANNMLTETALSCLLTMEIASEKDARQTIPTGYTLNDEATRLLRARLILEEALETVRGLGFDVLPKVPTDEPISCIDDLAITANYHQIPMREPNLEDIIDGCCDLIYVATGTLCACGAPDKLHLHLVNEANNAKFPHAQATTDANGKYQKPPGWQPPNHQKLIDAGPHYLANIAARLVEDLKAKS